MNVAVLNITALSELRSRVRALGKILDEIINNSRQVEGRYGSPCGTSNSNQQQLSKTISVSREVYDVLLLVGEEGITSGEVLRQLEMRRSVTWAAVRQAMYRLKTTGKARRVGRLWYPAS